MASESRSFCLRVIKQAYGYDYNPDWHADLDSLGTPTDAYAGSRGGAWCEIKVNGQLVACGGLRRLQSHPRSFEAFASRYTGQSVAGVWRVYVEPVWQARGLGGAIYRALETEATRLDYCLLYLHTSAHNPRAVAFWRQQGFSVFRRDDDNGRTVHMEKRLP